jgi:phosphoenolpyruvate carboxylase
MHNPTPTEVLDVVGRLEAEQEIPDAMRADVRLLGRLLGHVLMESGSEGLFEDVERLRAATIEAYTSPASDAFDRAVQIVESFDLQRADEVARAFTVYFHLVNLAEERQRVRALRDRDGVASRDSRGTVAGAYAALAPHRGPPSRDLDEHPASDDPRGRARRGTSRRRRGAPHPAPHARRDRCSLAHLADPP